MMSRYKAVAMAGLCFGIVAAALLGSCALFPHRVSREQIAEDLQNTIETIDNANEFYFDDNGKDADSVEQLEKLEYLTIDPETRTWFEYEFVKQDGRLVSIIATSTRKAPCGKGKKIVYDAATGEFSGELAR
jgi:hypothetical protein